MDWQAIEPDALRWACARHRVAGLVHRGLRALGIARDFPGIGEDARRIAADNLRLADRAFALRDTFDGAAVPVAFVKGLAVGALAYGDVATKMSADIDLLVRHADLCRAARQLHDLGYRCVTPRRANLIAWHGRNKESVWLGEDGVVVDLHSRLADAPTLFAAASDEFQIETVDVMPGQPLPTIPRETLLPYLAVHGLSSLWFRLKWVADYAAIRARSPRSPAPAGAARAVRVADRLASLLFDLPIEPPKLGWSERWLVNQSIAQLTHHRVPTDRFLGTLPIHVGQAILVEGLGFAGRDAIRQARTVVGRD